MMYMYSNIVTLDNWINQGIIKESFFSIMIEVITYGQA